MNWTNDKPVFSEDCVLVTADKFKGGWDYNIYEIRYLFLGGASWRWQWLDNSENDLGDINDLKADKYLILPKHE